LISEQKIPKAILLSEFLFLYFWLEKESSRSPQGRSKKLAAKLVFVA